MESDVFDRQNKRFKSLTVFGAMFLGKSVANFVQYAFKNKLLRIDLVDNTRQGFVRITIL